MICPASGERGGGARSTNSERCLVCLRGGKVAAAAAGRGGVLERVGGCNTARAASGAHEAHNNYCQVSEVLRTRRV
jgi:hypothetical protein